MCFSSDGGRHTRCALVAGVQTVALPISKDSIIESAFASGTTIGGFAFFVGVFAALLTSFYSWRLVFLTFFGKARWAASEHIQHALHGDAHDHPDDQTAGEEPHVGDPGARDIPAGTGGYHHPERPWTMLSPLTLPALRAVLTGFLYHGPFLERPEAAEFLAVP